MAVIALTAKYPNRPVDILLRSQFLGPPCLCSKASNKNNIQYLAKFLGLLGKYHVKQTISKLILSTVNHFLSHEKWSSSNKKRQPRKCQWKKVLLKFSQYLQEKYLRWSLFLIKLQAFLITPVWRIFASGCFSLISSPWKDDMIHFTIRHRLSWFILFSSCSIKFRDESATFIMWDLFLTEQRFLSANVL